VKQKIIAASVTGSSSSNSIRPDSIEGIGNTKSSSGIGASAIGESELHRVRIPRRFYGFSYETFVVRMMRDWSAVCLALYRKEDVRGKEVRYVVVNPTKTSLLRKSDYAFLLAPKEPILI
jgi:hypothetical protein